MAHEDRSSWKYPGSYNYYLVGRKGWMRGLSLSAHARARRNRNRSHGQQGPDPGGHYPVCAAGTGGFFDEKFPKTGYQYRQNQGKNGFTGNKGVSFSGKNGYFVPIETIFQ